LCNVTTLQVLDLVADFLFEPTPAAAARVAALLRLMDGITSDRDQEFARQLVRKVCSLKT
jgi:hypothetical protein